MAVIIALSGPFPSIQLESPDLFYASVLCLFNKFLVICCLFFDLFYTNHLKIAVTFAVYLKFCHANLNNLNHESQKITKLFLFHVEKNIFF